MICAKCGANNPSESAYCGGCGSFLEPAAAERPVAPEQASPAVFFGGPSAIAPAEDSPTLRSVAELPGVPAPQSPSSAPLPGEQFPFGSSTPDAGVNLPPAQSWPIPAPAPAQTPGFSSGGYPAQGVASAPGWPAPAQGPASTPGFVSGAYPAQGVAPAQGPASTPGFTSGAYPPAAGAEFPAGVYPTPGAAFTSGAYPPVTPVPGQVSGVQQSQPGWGAYPGQPSQPGWGAYPGQVPAPAAPAGPSRLVKPLPVWAFIASIVVVALVLGLLLFFTGSDWAAGAQTAGIVALIVGALILIAFGVRSALGMLVATNMHRRSQIISAILLALILFAVGAIGLTQGLGIHAVQGHFLEGQQKWQLAINEYQASGQAAPASNDIARTYVEWGEQLSGQQPQSQQQYSDALNKFNTVITTYTQASSEVASAEKDSISTYQAAGKFASQSKNYTVATQSYDALLGQQYCTTTCQSQTGALDATAYYNLAEQTLGAQQYDKSVAAFNALTTKFASSPEAQRAHADYAKALWGNGQAQLTATCSSAVATYQQLSTSFSDTTEGQEAATALKQPQAVKGHFTSTIPSGTNTPAVGLVQGVSANTPSTTFYTILAKSPVTAVQSDGTFQFRPVAQGTYYLVWGVLNSADNMEDFFVGQRYPATVGPLCAFNFGDISEAFPTA